jgi:SWI/SNF-related matrix-associated actin-dependent regulator of chromatin subfamily A member 5
MAPQRAKTAFQFYQAESLSDIKAELGGSMGEAMVVLSKRWKALSDSERKKYKILEKEEKDRFERESREADDLAMQEQERKRQAMTSVSQGEERGARAKLDAERLAKQEKRRQRELDVDPEVLHERERLKKIKKKETQERQNQRDKEEKAVAERHRKLDKQAAVKATQRLDYLFKQSSIFAKLKMGSGSAQPAPMSPKSMVHHRDGKIHHDESDELDKSDDEEEEHVFLTKQPSTIVGGTLKPYQLEGLNWMIHLAEKGLNGILADEMGLGKTLQSISILAYQYEFLNIQGPHLIVVPKSTLSNWMNELKRWCPSLRAIRFHGVKEEREALIAEYFTNEAAAHDGRRPRNRVKNEETGEWEDDNSDNPLAWDVCVTTYEVCNTERKTLQKFAWRYLVIDEVRWSSGMCMVVELCFVSTDNCCTKQTIMYLA